MHVADTATVQHISAVILAGGEGHRMGGRDKGLLPLAGKPLIQWVMERIAPQADEILISANRHLDEYGGFGHRVLKDPGTELAGPLAGLLEGMRHARHPLVLCVPCDAPLLPLDLVQRLRQALVESGARLAVARAAGRTHYTTLLAYRELAPGLTAFLAHGGRRVAEWQAGVSRTEVDFPDAPAFSNLNSPDLLQKLESRLRSRSEP